MRSCGTWAKVAPLLMAWWVLPNCAPDEATQVVVVVDSDMPTDMRPETIVLTANLAGHAMETLTANVAAQGLPLSFALVHAGGALGPLKLRVEGRRGQQAVTRDAELSFVPDNVVVLRMDLFSACAEVVCEASNTCTETGCVPATVAGARQSSWQGNLGTLPAWRGDAMASMQPDGGTTDTSTFSPLDGRASDGAQGVDTAVTRDGSTQDAPRTDAPDGSVSFASLGTCNMFPGNMVWNVDVRGQSVSAQSSAYLASVGNQDTPLSVDFGVNKGVIWASVKDSEPTIAVELSKLNIRVMWPIPGDFPLNASPASRLVVVNTDKCLLYEGSGCQKLSREFACETGGAVALSGNWVRQPGSVLAQDSGLAVLPGLVRVQEVQNGRIDHALNITMAPLQRGFVEPALNHIGGNSSSPTLPPMGIRLRLRADFPEAGLSAAAKVVVTAMKTYGLLVTHRGTTLGLMGERHPGWAAYDLSGLNAIQLEDFEVLEHGMITL